MTSMSSCSNSEEKLQESMEQRQKEVRAALDRLEAALSEGGELLTEERLAILALPPTTLLHRLRDGHLAPTHVLQAFQAKEWAASLEEAPLETRNLPLYGLPVSVKENIDVEGRDTTLGLAKNLYRPAFRHAALVQALKAQGAVPFCKTNVPQTCISNPVWGETVNPANTQRTSGGSSGGEGALVGAGGSVLGVGSDLGGSVRIPAHFCGVVGLKTTRGRLSTQGVLSVMNGDVGIRGSPGLLGRDVEIVVAGLRALLEGGCMFELDPQLPPISWRHHLYTDDRPLRVGWYDDDNVFPITPGCRRAVAEARDAFHAAGHHIVAFSPPDVRHAWNLITAIYTADQGRTVQHLLDGEASSSHQLLRVLGSQAEYVEEFVDAWTSCHLDVLLCPAFPMPAPPPSYPTKTMAALLTTCLYNLCNFPAGVVPVTHETEEDQEKLEDYPTTDLMFQLVKESSGHSPCSPRAASPAGPKPYPHSTRGHSVHSPRVVCPQQTPGHISEFEVLGPHKGTITSEAVYTCPAQGIWKWDSDELDAYVEY
ncbi:Fatty acid amide hydrolase 1-like [Homarus americanus]|uniref:Fatty acid amide hydrolase 1-like n=1 Tax=Homarus americanus TaxID=6706 RepID=A0A8J5N568_HOMAM|nr:Fatty acid amide hydrolase 1-like [Homarus americanus]